MASCKISVIVPCYNSAPYIAETLDSLLAQTFRNWECIIVDDGSSDNPEAVVSPYLKSDARFRFYRQENSGPAAARNNALSHSCGEYVLPLDSDDKIHPRYMEKAMDYFGKHPQTRLVYCKARYFGASDEKWWLPEYSYDRFIARNCIFVSSFFRREDALKAGGFDESFRKGFEDWDFFLRLLSREDKVYRMDEELFYYRQHKTTSVNTRAAMIEGELMEAIAHKYPEIYRHVTENPIPYMRAAVDLQDKKDRAQRRAMLWKHPLRIFKKKTSLR